ncbi:MAG: T9SS type A sorting domain-containing protein [Ignavibacteriaceae bacterium]|nr:T9SS type A sorting domain-containing protein [Ignavibacteriaceae bacterium]
MEYAGVIYQRDNTLLPSGWMDMDRNFYHNLTNNNGDSLVELSEKALAFNTDNYEDGDYRIIIEVYDEMGNYDIDSMDVKFKNGNPVEVENDEGKIYSFALEQNYPNPFNSTTKIKFSIPQSPLLGGDGRGGLVTLKVYDILGNEVATLVNEELAAGEFEVEFNATSHSGEGRNLVSGIYFFQLKSGNYIETKKMLLLK